MHRLWQCESSTSRLRQASSCSGLAVVPCEQRGCVCMCRRCMCMRCICSEASHMCVLTGVNYAKHTWLIHHRSSICACIA